MRPVSRLFIISLLLVPALVRADDPLNDVSGIEDWYTPRQLRRPVDSQQAIRLQAEQAQTAEEVRADRQRFSAEQAEFVADFEALERARHRRQRADIRVEPRRPAPAEQWLSDEQRRLERAAESALRARSPEPAPPVASAAEAAFDAPIRAENAKSDTVGSRADGAFDTAPVALRSPSREPSADLEPAAPAFLEPERPARAEQASPAEQARPESPAARRAEARAAERAEAERLAREQEAARRLGGRLDADGQFVDPDLQGP